MDTCIEADQKTLDLLKDMIESLKDRPLDMDTFRAAYAARFNDVPDDFVVTRDDLASVVVHVPIPGIIGIMVSDVDGVSSWAMGTDDWDVYFFD